tara:strand:- start:578 stop:1237 length:660 start_codon:yes stop_codon:yes gene_type:complete
MQIFLDTADTSLIEKHFETGLIDGVTTNPTLIMKSGRDPEDVYQTIKDIGVQDISMEVVGDVNTMFNEGARLYDKFGSICTVKVPCSPDGLRVCKRLSDLNISVNVTLIFDAAQAILASKAGATYVSPFVGRLDDNSITGLDLIKSISDIYNVQDVHQTKILSASIRDVKSVSQSFAYGAGVVTIPPVVFEKMYNHVLTDKGLAQFDKDWTDVQKLVGG